MKRGDSLTGSLFADPPKPERPVYRELIPQPEDVAADAFAESLPVAKTRSLAHVIAPTADAQSNDVDQPAPPAREYERKPDGVTVVCRLDGRFMVSRVRDDGTTYADVFFTRGELEELIVRAAEALR